AKLEAGEGLAKTTNVASGVATILLGIPTNAQLRALSLALDGPQAYYDWLALTNGVVAVPAWNAGHGQPRAPGLYFFNTNGAAVAPDGSAYSYAMPGIVSLSAGTNVVVTGAGYPQLGELHFFSSLPQAPFSAYPGRRVGRTLTNGWDLRGKLVQQRATGTISA